MSVKIIFSAPPTKVKVNKILIVILFFQVGLYSFFHRLYGMFPCNFLSYLRMQYSDSNKEQQARRIFYYFDEGLKSGKMH
jgi:hypothetical protein